MNILAIIVASLVPMIVGAIWYNPKVMGNLWMKEAGMTDEKIQGANMTKIYLLALLFSFMLAFVNSTWVIHQLGVESTLFESLNTKSTTPEALSEKAEAEKVLAMFKGDGIFADNHRSFGHGVLHGIIFAIFVVLPIIGTNALFERKSAKYILLNVAYWLISLAIMGGITCMWK